MDDDRRNRYQRQIAPPATIRIISSKVPTFGQAEVPRARRFHYGLICFDDATIIHFTATAAGPGTPVIAGHSTELGLLVMRDFAARLRSSGNRPREPTRIYSLAEVIVVAALLLAFQRVENLGFLRLLRCLCQTHAGHLLRDFRHASLFLRTQEDAVQAADNLFMLLFGTTSFVFVTGSWGRDGPMGQVDAL